VNQEPTTIFEPQIVAQIRTDKEIRKY